MRILALLTAAVLVGHGVVVQQTALSLASGGPVGVRVFTTRTLQVKTEGAAPAGSATAPPALRKPAPARPPPKPAPALQNAGGSAPSAQETPQATEQARTSEPVVEPAAPPAIPPEPAASVAQASPEPAPAPAPAPAAAPPAASTPPGLPRDVALVARNYSVPGSVRLKFNAEGMRGKLQYHASGEMAWLHDGSSYEASLELGAFLVGSRVLRSTGRLTGDGLAPNRFSDRFRSEQAAHFDRSRGRVTFSANAPEAELLPGAQDQLSVFVQLASMVAGEPARYPPGSSITMQAVGTRTAEPWLFTVEAQEKLSLPGGTLDTLKLTRQPRREYDQKVEIWLAPALSYLPARIRITQTNGDFIDQQWRATGRP